MIRILTVCCILFAVAAFAVMSVESPVQITSFTPRLVNPGDEFMVRISIDKSSLRKGAVFQQVLPDGMTASPIENESAQFSFENQMVRFVWETLPEKSNLLLAYKIKVSDQIEGVNKISGTFIYSKGNSTAQMYLPEDLIYVSNEIPVSNAEHITGSKGNLSMVRIIDDKKGEESNGHRITIEVTGNNEKGFASWTDQIPYGYTVEVNQASNGLFRMDGTMVKFHWDEMPAENFWSFSYTLLPKQGMNFVDKPEVLGILVYGTKESVKTCIPILQSVSSATASLRRNESKAIAQASNPAPTVTAATPTIQRGLYYRVQIAATKKSPVRDSKFFSSNYKINSPVDMIEHEGWRKYCIGSFARMEPAKSFAIETRSTVPGAFVVAYRDGQRIPVNEAMQSLSISQ